jgi:hypothetical protein
MNLLAQLIRNNASVCRGMALRGIFHGPSPCAHIGSNLM